MERKRRSPKRLTLELYEIKIPKQTFLNKLADDFSNTQYPIRKKKAEKYLNKIWENMPEEDLSTGEILFIASSLMINALNFIPVGFYARGRFKDLLFKRIRQYTCE